MRLVGGAEGAVGPVVGCWVGGGGCRLLCGEVWGVVGVDGVGEVYFFVVEPLWCVCAYLSWGGVYVCRWCVCVWRLGFLKLC